MKTIILTGGIGTGKSTVGHMLQELGAEVIDSDRLGREALEPGTPGYTETVKTFGPGILAADGKVDRPALARVVFKQPEALLKLNGILHPIVDAEIFRRLEENEKRGIKASFVEMAIIANPAYLERGDEFWVVKATREVILERLTSRGINREDALARMANQPPVEEKIKGKTVIILNDGDKTQLKAQLKRLWEELTDSGMRY